MSDNGASAEGGPQGSFNEMYFFNFVPESLEENLSRIDDLGTPRAYNHYPWGWAWAGNTPLKRWKRETHEGGVTDPLIFSWPTGLGRPGETRHQYVHAIDVLPTLLELIGIDAPDEINGVQQTPIEGISLRLDAPRPRGAAATHVTQYYEMMGSRALYHDGWKAVAFHPLLTWSTTATAATRGALRRRRMGAVPRRRRPLRDRRPRREGAREAGGADRPWWIEAERFQVLPLNNQPGQHGDHRSRHDRYVFHPGIGTLPEAVAPNLRNRGFHLVAELDVPDEDADADGVVVAHGGPPGGYAVLHQDHRLHYVDNLLGATVITVSAASTCPGRTDARVVFTPTAPFPGTSRCSTATFRSARVTSSARLRSRSASRASASATSVGRRSRGLRGAVRHRTPGAAAGRDRRHRPPAS